MILRKLTEADYPAVLALTRELDQLHVQARPDYFPPAEDPYPQKYYNEALLNPTCLLLGAFDKNDALAGYVRATVRMGSGMIKTIKTVCLDDLFVSRASRRHGIAFALYAETERWAKEQGAERIDLTVWAFNEDALGLYRSLVWNPSGIFLKEAVNRTTPTTMQAAGGSVYFKNSFSSLKFSFL